MKIEKMAKNLILKNGIIKDPFHGKTIAGDIWLKDGKIASVGKVDAPKDSLTIDCSGKVITHGFVIFMFIFVNREEKIKKHL